MIKSYHTITQNWNISNNPKLNFRTKVTRATNLELQRTLRDICIGIFLLIFEKNEKITLYHFRQLCETALIIRLSKQQSCTFFMIYFKKQKNVYKKQKNAKEKVFLFFAFSIISCQAQSKIHSGLSAQEGNQHILNRNLIIIKN